MPSSEWTPISRAAAVLLAAAVARGLLAPPGGGPLPLPGRPDVADSLIVAGDSAAEERDRRARPLEVGEMLDPNQASEVELDRLPGIGASKARAIVDARESGGRFETLGDLTRVPGIGPATVGRLADYLDLPTEAATTGRNGVKDGSAGRRPLVEMARGGEGRDSRLDLNRAGRAELEALPGVGPVLAGRIIAMRQARGGFSNPGELIEVSGIGPAMLERLERMVTTRR